MKSFPQLFQRIWALPLLFFFSGCVNDEAPNPKPQIDFTTYNGQIAALPGDTINTSVTVTAPGKLALFRGRKGSQEIVNVTTFPENRLEYPLQEFIPVTAQEGEKTVYTFTARTDKGEETTRDLVITVSSFKEYAAVNLGNGNGTNGSFFAAATGQVISQANARSQARQIDLVFFQRNTTENASLAAPANDSVQVVFGANTTANLPAWETRNATNLKMLGSDSTIYQKATNARLIAAAFQNHPAAAASLLTNLKPGDVIGFQTAAGKYGLARVTNLSTTAATPFTSQLQLTVKMQR